MRNGLQSDRAEQQLGRHMVNVRDERHAHPWADRLVLQAQAVRIPAGPVAENERSGNCHQKSHRQDDQVGGAPHSSNIDGMALLRCPSCAVENPNTASSCISCAAPLSSPSLIATVATPSLSSSSMDEGRFPPGTLLAERYRIIGLLGKGGMGEVYRANDLRLGQAVALKFLPEKTARDGQALARFYTEVRIARQVSHPNVCRVYDIGEVDGLPFLSMEYVDGEDLASLLRRIGRLPPDKALDIARRLCTGLAAAHETGVLHRDLKPANIMIDGRGQARIADFGLAAVAGTLEAAEIRNGTPAYMAPEQLAGREVTVKSDLYALGLVLYEIFTGKPAFQANSLAELVRMQEQTAPSSMTTLVRDLDPSVERVILRCLAPDPRNRPGSALAIAAALPGGDPLAAALAAGETPSPEMVAAAGETEGLRPAVAIPMLAAVVAVLLVLAILGGKFNLIAKTPFDNSPAALEVLARDMLKRLGYTQRPAGRASGMDHEEAYLDYMRDNQPPQTRWSHLAAGQPAPIVFWYRQSPRALNPGGELMVDWDNPQFTVSGMLRMRLDMQARLISFETVPPEWEDPKDSPPAPDWSAFFTSAGLDAARFQPAVPQWAPAMACDARAAWTGNWPEAPEIPIRIEAAAWRGKPVSFQIIEPWTRAASMEAHPQSDAQNAGHFTVIVLFVAMLAIACALAWHNLKARRGDQRGAVRLAFFMLWVAMLRYTVSMHHVADLHELVNLIRALERSLFLAAGTWILYMALEPYVRARWPQTLISWARILAGKLRDPLVGKHILVGAVFGMVYPLVGKTGSLWKTHLGNWPELMDLDNLMGAGGLIGHFLEHLIGGLQFGLACFFLIFLLRLGLRRSWLAGLAFTAILTAEQSLGSHYPLLDTAYFTLAYAFTFLILLRFGLTPLVVGLAIADFVGSSPLTLDPSAWYFGSSMAVLLVVVGIAAYGFQTSVAGRPLIKDEILER
jgi:Protein kinase domain